MDGRPHKLDQMNRIVNFRRDSIFSTFFKLHQNLSRTLIWFPSNFNLLKNSTSSKKLNLTTHKFYWFSLKVFKCMWPAPRTNESHTKIKTPWIFMAAEVHWDCMLRWEKLNKFFPNPQNVYPFPRHMYGFCI